MVGSQVEPMASTSAATQQWSRSPSLASTAPPHPAMNELWLPLPHLTQLWMSTSLASADPAHSAMNVLWPPQTQFAQLWMSTSLASTAPPLSATNEYFSGLHWPSPLNFEWALTSTDPVHSVMNKYLSDLHWPICSIMNEYLSKLHWPSYKWVPLWPPLTHLTLLWISFYCEEQMLRQLTFSCNAPTLSTHHRHTKHPVHDFVNICKSYTTLKLHWMRMKKTKLQFTFPTHQWSWIKVKVMKSGMNQQNPIMVKIKQSFKYLT